MSNLGGYQVMTVLAKKVGGPIQLVVLIAGGRYIVLRGGEAVIKRTIKAAKKKAITEKRKVFSVVSDGKADSGLELHVGDKYRILESDGEAILIEKLGDPNNPYFVSDDFLCSISDYKK